MRITVKARTYEEARSKLARRMAISIICDAGGGWMFFTFDGPL